MNKPSRPKQDKPKEEKPARRNAGDNQRGFGAVGFLIAASTLVTTVLFAATGGPKLPPANGD